MYKVHQYIHRTCFIFRNPQPTTVKVQEIFRPFVHRIWFLLITVALMSLIVLALNLKYEEADSGYLRLSISFIIIIGSLCQQGNFFSFFFINLSNNFLALL